MKKSTVKLEFSQKDYLSIQKIAFGKSKFKLIEVIAMLSILFSCILFIPERAFGDIVWFSFFRTTFIIILISTFLTYLALTSTWVGNYRDEFKKPIELELSESEISWKSIYERIRIDWDKVIETRSDGNYLLLYFEKKSFVFLKLSELSEANLNFIKSKILSNQK